MKDQTPTKQQQQILPSSRVEAVSLMRRKLREQQIHRSNRVVVVGRA
jgi:hypothetical protein